MKLYVANLRSVTLSPKSANMPFPPEVVYTAAAKFSAVLGHNGNLQM
jgi:hypothetical protein